MDERTPKTEQTAPRFFIKLRDCESRRQSIKYFIFAAIILACTYLTELLHLLDKPLFSLVYYGSVTKVMFSVSAAVLLTCLIIVFHHYCKKHTGTKLLTKRDDHITIKQRIALYVMTALPVIITGMFLNFQFKVVYELGEKVNMYTLLSNLSGYALVAAKHFAYLYFIMLVQTACERIFDASHPLPFGGVACMLTFGLIEVFVTPSIFSWLYFALCLYYGIVYLVSGKRFFVTYTLMLILYVL